MSKSKGASQLSEAGGFHCAGGNRRHFHDRQDEPLPYKL